LDLFKSTFQSLTIWAKTKETTKQWKHRNYSAKRKQKHYNIPNLKLLLKET